MQYSPRFKQAASTFLLMFTALIWGMCFVAQRSSMDYIGPFLFNGIREVLGSCTLALVLLVVWLIQRRRLRRCPRSPETALRNEVSSAPPGVARCELSHTSRKRTKHRGHAKHRAGYRYLFLAGLVCGVALYLASNLQQVAMVSVTASKAAFITTLYIVLVPVLGLFLRQRTHWNTWVSVLIAVAGLYLLCINDTLALQPGDAILLVSALFWAVHILVVGHYAPRLGMLQLFGMCVVQFAVAGILSLASAPCIDAFFVPQTPSFEAVSYVAGELAYAGMLSTAGAFTLAAVGQRYAKPTSAAVVMSLESVFGLLGGVVLLGELLSPRESIGCVLMFAAVLLTQFEWKLPRARLSTR